MPMQHDASGIVTACSKSFRSIPDAQRSRAISGSRRRAAAHRADRTASAGANSRRRRTEARVRTRMTSTALDPVTGIAQIALAPADGRDRQGARAQAQGSDPRRGHLGAGRRRREARLLRLSSRLREEGVAILYVSHRMQEIEDLADACERLPQRLGTSRAFQKGARSSPTRRSVADDDRARGEHRSLSGRSRPRSRPMARTVVACELKRLCPGPARVAATSSLEIRQGRDHRARRASTDKVNANCCSPSSAS